MSSSDTNVEQLLKRLSRTRFDEFPDAGRGRGSGENSEQGQQRGGRRRGSGRFRGNADFQTNGRGAVNNSSLSDRGRGHASNIVRGRGAFSCSSSSRGRDNNVRRRSLSRNSQPNSERESNSVRSTNQNDNNARQTDDRSARSKQGPLRKYPCSYKSLEELMDKNSREVVLTLQDPFFGFKELLASNSIKNEVIVAIIRLLSVAVTCINCPESQTVLLNDAMSSQLFTSHIPRYMAKAPHDRLERWRLPQTMEQFLVICRKLLLIFPHKASDELGIAFVTCNDFVQRNAELGLGIDPKSCADFKELDGIRVAILAKFDAPTRDKMAREEAEAARPPPNDFRSMAVTPTHADIHETLQPFLRPNIVGGTFASVEHYLDVHFRLMREDFISPLRDGLINYLSLVSRGQAHKVNQRDIKIYYNVRVIMPECTPFDGLVYVLGFSLEHLKRVNWEATKRLLHGSLVCLSSDNFHTFLLATIVKRDPKKLNEGYVSVRFILDEDKAAWDINPNEIFTMIESPAYFEAYSPILKGLQNMNEEALPFQRYILGGNSDVKVPEYLSQNTEYVITPLLDPEIQSTRSPMCRLLNDTSWPTAEDMNLDPAQYSALKAALTREMTIIQGPPGTGKTFLGLKILDVLLANMEQWGQGSSPILVICYTNHALDQFLEGILGFAKQGIVRVGGQSKCDALAPYNLTQLRRNMTSERRVANYVYHSRQKLYWQMHQIQDEIAKQAYAIKVSETKIVHEYLLEEFMSDADYNQLMHLNQFNRQPRKTVSCMMEWLGLLGMVEFGDEDMEGAQAQAATPSQNEEGEELELEEDVLALEEMGKRIMDNYAYDDLQAEVKDLQLQQNKKKGKHEKIQEKVLLNQDGWQVQGGHRKIQQTISKEMKRTDMMDEIEADRIRNIHGLNINDRWRLYRFWLSKMRAKMAQSIRALQQEYHGCFKQLREVMTEIDIAILRDAHVIGMTTTGAAKCRDVLQIISPKIVIVEEAAEVLEAHIITALTAHCEHLILIGDQQQLRPNPTVYKLAKDYHLDVSLFERLIKNGVPYERLTLQHRMRPRIAALLVPHIYPDLRNHFSVEKYDDVRGVDANVYFINHNHLESTVTDSQSRANEYEARFLVALCRYLLLQGYDSTKITMLTTYLGQLFLFKKLTKNTIVGGVRCTVVDNYQGEENDIILLSLVRSNAEGTVGFLKVDNRICVALSRAKMGLFCIGNFDFLDENAATWKPIIASMKRDNLIGPQLSLRCQNHPQTATLVSVPDDFNKVPEGGCQLPCDYRLPCGHRCPKVCHVYDKDHLEMKCMKPCERVLCDVGHKCLKQCHEACGKCVVMVTKVLPCGHENMLQCHRDPFTAMCQHKCEKILECLHACAKKCSDPCNLNDCQMKVQRKAQCGHTVAVACSMTQNPSIVLRECKHPCSRPDELLPCKHHCAGSCFLCCQGRLHVRCKEKCGRTLICGHSCKVPCAKNCPPCMEQCENRCFHSRCPNSCGVPCHSCKEPCAWQCEHYQCTKLCHEICNRPPCNEPCTKTLPCEHPCIGLCGEPCPPLCRICDKEKVCEVFFGNEEEEDARFVLLEDCGHVIESEAMDHWIREGTESKGDAHCTVVMKTCPKCKTIIKRNLRYGPVIKRILEDVMVIKRKIFGNAANIQQEFKRLKSEIGALEGGRFIKCELQLVAEINKESRQSYNELVTLRNKLEFLFKMNNLWKKNPDYIKPEPKPPKAKGPVVRASVAQRVLGQRLADYDAPALAEERKLKLHTREDWAVVNEKLLELEKWHLRLDHLSSEREIYDFSRQLARVTQLSIFLKQVEGKYMHTDAKACYDGILGSFTGCKPFTDTIEEHVDKEIKRLGTLMTGLAITEREKMEIIKAIALGPGHWFKCPNGHFYAIGECGGAMQVGRCIECNMEIGGTQHRLLSGQRVAMEMDGATRPAYPGGYQ